MVLPTGIRLGRYEVLAPLGEGGMGEVYRARDERLGRDVVIKLLPSSFSTDPDRVRRFEQEARATGALNHPNVIVVHDTGQHDGAPYVVYELLEGTTLRALLNSTPLSASRIIRLGTDIAAGLAAAHDHGIVHRDLKPENLFVTREGRAKILDFGIASVAECSALAADTVTKQTTAPGLIVGTVGYMSPEQARGTRVDNRSDIFSLGIVLYEMLSGHARLALSVGARRRFRVGRVIDAIGYACGGTGDTNYVDRCDGRNGRGDRSGRTACPTTGCPRAAHAL